MGLTMAEKVLARASGRDEVRPEQFVTASVDKHSSAWRRRTSSPSSTGAPSTSSSTRCQAPTNRSGRFSL